MIKTLSEECSEFIKESFPYPLLKTLPVTKDGFIKLKIRHKKNKKYLSSKTFNIFNSALEKYHTNITFKALYGYPIEAVETLSESESTRELFYIFPTNGYKYIYNPNVKSSFAAYNDALSKLQGNNLETAFKEILQESYVDKDLKNAMISGSEVIFFNISHYYAIRKSLIESSYEEFINLNGYLKKNG
jgi:hypothetical protein